ncbi:hypothetical protein DUI87_18793 [Hirundo rustica rustica]|uniref:Peptidase A2 domain-containing protein n=1 Tax=Hirundo rustica rustica TaxID=333673 RepID=A0A3M0JUE1_HIRRU|nr:hypothetical protein DUI87_18793 [Hirundo rustica rustica]
MWKKLSKKHLQISNKDSVTSVANQGISRRTAHKLQTIQTHQIIVQHAGEGSIALQETMQVEELSRETPEGARIISAQHTSDGDDSRASSARGTIIGEQHSDALSRTICRIPSDPELLPPGAQCDLATSKVICFLDDNYAVIPTGVTGSSWKRQDFLIIGKDRSSVLGLVIYPSVISADHNDELTVLAKPHQPPLIIPPNTSIARAIALPPHAAEQVLPVLREQDPPSGEHMEVHASWVKHIGRERPILVCELTQGDKTIAVKGMLDTGADVTAFASLGVPQEIKTDNGPTYIGKVLDKFLKSLAQSFAEGKKTLKPPESRNKKLREKPHSFGKALGFLATDKDDGPENQHFPSDKLKTKIPVNKERGTTDPCCRPPSPDNVLLLDKLEEDPDDRALLPPAEPPAEPTIGLKELTEQIQAVMQRLDERAHAAAEPLSMPMVNGRDEPTSFSSQLTPMQQLLEQTAESTSQATPSPAPPVTWWSRIIRDAIL